MFLYFRKKKLQFALIAAIFCICIISSTIAFSQTHTQLPNKITIAVRTNIPVFGKFIQDNQLEESFCKTFGKELEKELFKKNVGIRVDFDIVRNENKGPNFPRYYGLKNRNHNIQCGANSISPRPNIIFSDAFYQTGIKLLMKKEIFNQYLSHLSPKNKRETVKQEFEIAVEDNTTTYSNLRNQDFNVKRYSNKDAALDALKTKEKIAFASDAIILRSFIKEGYPGEIEFQQEDYMIFPEESRNYIIDNPEKYGIAISDAGDKSKYSGELQKAINNVLKTDALQEERNKLQKYEDGGKSNDGGFWENFVLIIVIGLLLVAMILTSLAFFIK